MSLQALAALPGHTNGVRSDVFFLILCARGSSTIHLQTAPIEETLAPQEADTNDQAIAGVATGNVVELCVLVHSRWTTPD